MKINFSTVLRYKKKLRKDMSETFNIVAKVAGDGNRHKIKHLKEEDVIAHLPWYRESDYGEVVERP